MAGMRSRQRGAILVMTVFFVIVLIGIAAFALDLGRLYVLRTEMQNAVDAAALAAAAELDGKDHAKDRAISAAIKLLNHQGRFASNPELLSQLSHSNYTPGNLQDSVFIFYNWIGHEIDGPKPGVCPGDPTSETEKCVTDENSDAHYIKVRLDPGLAGDQYYGIDLYFIPILGLLTGESITKANTRVQAVAGAGSQVCNYPPMFMCAYDDSEANYPGIPVGAQVKLKDRDASDPWGPGNVGFLQPAGDVIVYEDDDFDSHDNPIDLSGNQAIAAGLANEKYNPCSPAIVSTKPGVTTGQTRRGFNTRFGIYEDFEDFKKSFPPAPNVVDYPRDDAFLDPDDPAYAGDNWAVTECLSTGSTTPSNPFCHSATRPEQFNITDFFAYYHGAAVPSGLSYRHTVYEWELANSALPALNSTDDDIVPLDTTNNYAQTNCFDDAKPGQKNCLVHNGDPRVNEGAYGVPYPVIGDADRRVLFVAVIKCGEYNIQGNSPDINLLQYGGFHKFFVTQHVQPPPYAEFFAEYLGPVSKQEEQKLIHTVIQLYE